MPSRFWRFDIYQDMEVLHLLHATRGVYWRFISITSNFNNIIDYVTIASTGDAIDFGDLTDATVYYPCMYQIKLEVYLLVDRSIMDQMLIY